MSKKKTAKVERFDSEGEFDLYDDEGNSLRSPIDASDIKVDLNLAKAVNNLVGQGLTSGVGSPKPGAMCVEAAVCYAIGQQHGDQPICVDPDLISAKITLNDTFTGPKKGAKKERGRVLRRVAIAQLGTRDRFDSTTYRNALEEAYNNWLTYRFNAAAAKADLTIDGPDSLDEVIETLEELRNTYQEQQGLGEYGTFDDVYDRVLQVINEGESYNATNKVKDEAVAIAAEIITQSLIAIKAPGAKFLNLVPLTKAEQVLFGVTK